MRLSTIWAASISACLLTVTVAHALTMPYGQREIAAAGVGCVGGMKSDHGNTAFFIGDTERLNEQLATLAKGSQSDRSVVVILHAGAKTVATPEEDPLTEVGNQTRNQLPISWSVNKSCPFDKVATGLCKCDERNVTVHIWVANAIRLEDLIVPTRFVVRSAGEIDEFVKRHGNRN